MTSWFAAGSLSLTTQPTSLRQVYSVCVCLSIHSSLMLQYVMLDHRFILGYTICFHLKLFSILGLQCLDLMLISPHLMRNTASCFLCLVSLFVHLLFETERGTESLSLCCISICGVVLTTHFSIHSDRKHNNNYSCCTAGQGILSGKRKKMIKKRR